MSEIHFDQDGEPNEPHANCTEIRWRYFPNPGTRGAPRIVHDKRTGGAPLYTPVDISYLELRDLVDGVAGYYRGDQVDQARRLIPSVKPFYVSIAATPRNAAGGGTADELVRHLVESNTRQSETLINQLAAVMREQRKTLKETRKVMRVVATADLRELFKQYAATVSLVDPDEDDDEETDADDIDVEGTSEGVVKDIKDITNQVFSAFETWMLDRQAQRAEAAKARVAEAQPTATPASSAPEPTPAPFAAPAPPAPAPPTPLPTAAPPSAPPAATIAGPAAAAPSTAAPPASGVRNAASSVPTPEQAQHLLAILSALEPHERTVARTVVHRMNAEQRAHWLGELSALTVDQAVELVRSMIPARTKKESES